jgi:predicted RNA-binding Zn-ribbon protein involved in translation (DUF1610 family)
MGPIEEPELVEGLAMFPPRDRCNVAPRVVVTEHNHTIMCPKCGKEVTKPSYHEAFQVWYQYCQ